jgi:hypothetical protein
MRSHDPAGPTCHSVWQRWKNSSEFTHQGWRTSANRSAFNVNEPARNESKRHRLRTTLAQPPASAVRSAGHPPRRRDSTIQRATRPTSQPERRPQAESKEGEHQARQKPRHAGSPARTTHREHQPSNASNQITPHRHSRPRPWHSRSPGSRVPGRHARHATSIDGAQQLNNPGRRNRRIRIVSHKTEPADRAPKLQVPKVRCDRPNEPSSARCPVLRPRAILAAWRALNSAARKKSISGSSLHSVSPARCP